MGPQEESRDGRSGVEPSGEGEEPKWWDSAEGHRFALEVLQLRARRDILKLVAAGVGSVEEVAGVLGIDEKRAAFHLAMLEKALVVEAASCGYRATPTGLLYLEKVEGSSPEGL
ncbi:winged helix-turn-helix domain-containing protein [Candidatus Methanocrinis natronophilus]|uniref:Winged helix-turn-helix domain-containing protein n=1 Tax=Candidatus Methanocrinis natronophilus TaxID=3033396 RepID=A0ABT5X8G6_9EURY|nr:winged helix-turn-helix domain-containing protein [Candidatus Methanocrinis natronophilus]MDF0590877.1 winged helix-turn-helix domain-containing protein [Candidatus Methanocrinis natronophilus]